jgi:hypothetical protein
MPSCAVFHQGHNPLNSQYVWDLLPFRFNLKGGETTLELGEEGEKQTDAKGPSLPVETIEEAAIETDLLPQVGVQPGICAVH